MKQIKKIVIGYIVVFAATTGFFAKDLFSEKSSVDKNKIDSVTLEKIDSPNIYTAKLDK